MKKVISLALVSMFALTGIALAEGTIIGTVVDQAGDPVADARVGLQEEEVCSTFVFTNEDGEFVFEDVLAGTYTVKASKRQAGNGTIEGVEVFDDETTELDPITLTAGGGSGPGGGGHGPNYQSGGGRR